MSSVDSGKTYDFSEWRLAFEVPLKLCKGEELEGATSDSYQKTLAYERHGRYLGSDRELRHIYLDLQSTSLMLDDRRASNACYEQMHNIFMMTPRLATFTTRKTAAHLSASSKPPSGTSSIGTSRGFTRRRSTS